MVDIDRLDDWINYITGPITLICVLMFFIRFRLQTDRAANVILFAFLLAITAREFLGGIDYSTIGLILPVSTCIIWAMLYIFVFEMAYIRAMLLSESHTQYAATRKRIWYSKAIVNALYFVIFVPMTLIAFVMTDEFLQNNRALFVTLMVTSRVAKLLIDLYIFPAFLVYYCFFISRKRELLRNKGEKFTIRNKLLIGWGFFIWLLKLGHTLANIFIVTIARIDPNPSEVIQLLYRVSIRTYVYIIDFLLLMTLLYLFYCQAIQAEVVTKERCKASLEGGMHTQAIMSTQQLESKEVTMPSTKLKTTRPLTINDESFSMSSEDELGKLVAEGQPYPKHRDSSGSIDESEQSSSFNENDGGEQQFRQFLLKHMAK